jgi:hypothetical protein
MCPRISRRPARLLLAYCCLVILVGRSAAQTEAPPQPVDTQGEIVFIPPATGAPADRLGAGTRQTEPGGLPALLLAPAEGGLSATPDPLLVWYLADPVDVPVTVTITPVSGLARGIVMTRDGPFAAGWHAVDLTASRASLAPGQLYRWEVRAGGRALSKSAFLEHRATAPLPRTAAEAAASGLWHDALAGLFDIDAAGRVRLRDAAALRSLARGAALDLTNIPEAQQ